MGSKEGGENRWGSWSERVMLPEAAGAFLLLRSSRNPGCAASGGRRTASSRPRTATSARSKSCTAFICRVHSLVRRMTGGRDADELTQDVFVRVWQKLGSFRGDSAFGTWLHRLAVNVVIERFRTDTARRQRLVDGEAIFETLSAPPRRRDISMDFEALEKLPDGAREIFVLHDVEGYKHTEIAALLGISSGTSKAQLHRARMMLRKHLR